MWNLIIHGVLVVSLVIGVVVDYRTKRIPNALTLPMIVAGVALNAFRAGNEGSTMAFLGILVGIGVFFIPFIMGGIGGGDVKLMAGIGALKGPYFIFVTFIITALAGGAKALFRLAARKDERSAVWSRLRASVTSIATGVKQQPEEKPSAFPYAICIVIGVIGSFTAGIVLKLW